MNPKKARQGIVIKTILMTILIVLGAIFGIDILINISIIVLVINLMFTFCGRCPNCKKGVIVDLRSDRRRCRHCRFYHG